MSIGPQDHFITWLLRFGSVFEVEEEGNIAMWRGRSEVQYQVWCLT